MTFVLPAPDTMPTGDFPAGLSYTAYAAYGTLGAPAAQSDRVVAVATVIDALAEGVRHSVVIRGAYDTSGYRADCQLLLWFAGPTADCLQGQLTGLRGPLRDLGLAAFWSALGVQREAEFNRRHVPAYYAGEPARDYVCVYPFVRTPEWYVLPAERRREMLAEHGALGRRFPDVRANTTSAFGLGDYEWLLAFEADDVVRIVDLIHTLRASDARLYTKNELPFITGRRKPLEEILGALT